MKRKPYYHTLDWKTIDDLATSLALDIKYKNGLFDIVISVGRGGMVPARLLSEKLEIKKVLYFDIKSYTADNKQGAIDAYPTLPDLSGKKVLAVDDCLFTGDTWKAVKKTLIDNFSVFGADLAVLYKNNQLKEQFDDCYSACLYNGAAEWLVFPWEVGLQAN